jgi:ribose transport system ATP-binding protein
MTELGAPSLDPDEKVKNLPMAKRQVAEILRAVVAGSRVVVFDESTASLPAEETEWALGLTLELARAGRLVFYISHRIGEIREVSNRVTILRGGEAVCSGLTAELSDDAMIEAMLGRELKTLYPPPLAAVDDSEQPLVVRNLRVGRLRGVDFEIHTGEILGIGGLQGQGQTDLLEGLYGRGAADITVNGKKRRIRRPGDAMRAGIALVPDDRRLEGLLITKTIRENISLPNLNSVRRGPLLSPLREVRFTRTAVARLNIKAESGEQLVSKLSGGNQQKVVVSKLLMLDAQILLLSDFTRGIDVGTKADLFQLLRELTASGKSIIFYSSDAQELVEMCDRILILRDGEISSVLSGTMRSVENVTRAAFGLALATRDLEHDR